MLELSADNGQQGPRTEGSASENRIVRGQSSPSGVRSLLDNGSTVESERIACLRVAGSEIGRVAPAPVVEKPDGPSCPEDHPVVLTGHPL